MNYIRQGVVMLVLLAGNWAWAWSVAQSSPASTQRRTYRHPGGSFASGRLFGYEDGLCDGAHDRRTGYSFRPTNSDNYKNADRGFTSTLGSKEQYSQTYRQGYAQGYRRGYYER